jgi:mycothiol synthase
MESVGQPNHSPKENLLIAESEGEIVGYAELRPESSIGRVVLRWLIHPKHQRKGLAAKLVDRAIYRTKELGVRMIHVNIPQENLMAKQLLTKMDFQFIRRFLELRLDLPKMHLPEISKISPQFRPLQPGEEEKLTQLQNRSFTGAWGYHANTVKEILYRINLPSSSPDEIILALDVDKPIGYCWIRITFWQDKAPSEGTGRIYMLGVDPEYRGSGLGRKLLLAGLSYLKRKGLQVVELTVDSENKVACNLYKSMGFKPWTSSLWYEKRLD